jgi:phospholipase/carboxylesterase
MAGLSRQALSLVHRVRAPGVGADPAARAPLLVLLHGVGSNELAMASLAGSFDPRFLVISARAPIAVAPFAFGWLHETFAPEGPLIDPAEGVAAAATVTRFIDEAVDAYQADAARVFVAGFSQGGIVALATMLIAPEKVAGVVCMSGRLPPEILPHAAPQDRLRNKPALVVHGRTDGTLGMAYGRTAHETLASHGLEVEFRDFDMDHTTTDESVSAVSVWLTRRLAS